MNVIKQSHEEAIHTLNKLKKETVTGLTLSSKEFQVPAELIEEIFSFLTGPGLTCCAQTNKEWYKIASQERLWKGIVEQYAIGDKKWKSIADIGKSDPIPKEMLKILKQPCPFFKGKQLGQTHMLVWIPSTLNGKPLTTNSLGQFVKNNGFSKNEFGYREYWSDFVAEYGDKPIEKSCWVLMTKNLIPEINYGYMNKNIKMLPDDYKVPQALEAAFCIFAKYYSSGKRLFKQESRKKGFIAPSYNAVCHEAINTPEANNVRTFVGCFSKKGLQIMYSLGSTCDGIAPIRKFV